MSYFLDRLQFLKRDTEEFADGHGFTKTESRDWENSYRARWQYDKIVRSTHGVNCTGSCSWKIYVKNGLVTWETQQTDYPRTRPDLPNHEPRGCPRGASYSWYLYSANRLKYPLVRGALLRLWREARKTMSPVDAWASIVNDPVKARSYKTQRGMGGFARVRWDEANEIIAASNLHTVKQHGPDRVIGFSPIPAMSMVSYASGARYLSLLGGACLSFYDWYCDLPPSSPQVWGEQTDVPESADWYNSRYLIAWGSNVPQTRTPDAHFFTEARYNGTKTVAITPDYAEVAKLTDHWLHPKQGTDAALAFAFGHVILKEFHVDKPADYFIDYCRQYTDMPLLVRLERRADGRLVPERFLRASDLGGLGESNNPEWKTLAFDEKSDQVTVPNGSVGFRWGEKGKWNIEEKDSAGRETRLRLSLKDAHDGIEAVSFPYFGGVEHDRFTASKFSDILERHIPVRRLKLSDGKQWEVATVYDLLLAHYGVDRGFGGGNVAANYDQDLPGTPAWQERITGVPRAEVIEIAREFADTAAKTRGRSMIIVGAGMNHWFHNDMNYRGLINLLMMCGCVGQTGGGWAHYVGQEKLRPQTGWQPLAFGLDWSKPPRQMNGTSFFYFMSDQWRYEKIEIREILSPLADPARYSGSQADLNLKAIRMGWLPSAPQLNRNPLEVARAAEAAGLPAADYVVQQLKGGQLDFAYADPDAPENFPRVMFIWRSNLLGSSGKGHEYMLRHLLGTRHGLQGKDLGERGAVKPEEIRWRDAAPEGKLDLLVTLDFRMCTTALYSDVVLPTATWYEKDDLNTSDMHPFIHPLSKAVDPAWEARSDWDIFRGIARSVSDMAPGVLGVEKDVVLVPTLHDTPNELAMPFGARDWKKGECEPVPGKTLPSIAMVERDYPNLYKKFTSLGPLLDKQGNGGKGLNWDTKDEVKFLGDLNHRVLDEGISKGRPNIYSAIDAAEVVLHLAPETNGHVAVKAWESLEAFTGREHTHLAVGKEHEAIRFRDIQAQPRKIISSPIWSGLEDEHVSYNAGYTNVHELIPWRT
ncbi:MAG TPA: nitrate reductase subunit alpha, partial [Steroidobacteraceae bacterium]|nr:nitrate reductase subunit alpha [Steroidobacteraceae bacterium]